MNKNRQSGFTLVELIVVIAILGILAGVGTVAYTGYVEKANKAVDQQLVADIEYALELAAASGDLAENGNGSVIVCYDPTNGKYVVVNGDGIDSAMKAVFGEDYETSLRLKYNGWTDRVSAEMMNYVNNSTFKADDATLGGLLDDVQMVVGILTGAINGGGVSITEGSGLADYLSSNGISTDSSNGQAIANATVMYVADNMTGVMQGEEAQKAFADEWNTSYADETVTLPKFESLSDPFSQLSAQFAYVEALASHVDEKTKGTAGATNYVEQLRGAKSSQNKAAVLTTMNEVLRSINSTKDKTAATAVANYFGYTVGSTGVVKPTDATSATGYQDGMAFLAYMQGVSSSAGSLIKNTDITKDGYYNDGAILNYVNNYVALNDTLTTNGISGSAITVFYTGGTVLCPQVNF